MQAVIPRSHSAEHMVDNLSVAHKIFLSESEMQALEALDGSIDLNILQSS